MLVAYYHFAARLPDRSFPGGRLSGRAREALCRRLLAGCGQDIDVGSRVFIGDGRYIRLGTSSGIGSGSRVYGALIGRDVICGRDVVFLKDNHRHDDLARPIREQGLTQPVLPVIGTEPGSETERSSSQDAEWGPARSSAPERSSLEM